MSEATNISQDRQRDLTPGAAAKLLSMSRNSIVKLIVAGEIEAWDARLPGTKLSRFRIPPHAIDRWKSSRRVQPVSAVAPTLTLPTTPIVRGALRSRIAAVNATNATSSRNGGRR